MSDTTNPEIPLIRAERVPENRRLAFLPMFFGVPLMMKGERACYAWLRTLAPSYGGGFWEFYTLDNGGFYLAPVLSEPLKCQSPNGHACELSPDAAGIVATLFALGQLCAETFDDVLGDRYHWLLAYADNHAEAGNIYALID